MNKIFWLLNKYGKLIRLSSFFILTVGLIYTVYILFFLHNTVCTTGKIVDIEQRKGDRGILYAVVFTYQDYDGNTYTKCSPLASSSPAGNIGEEFPVRYDPLNPKNAKLNIFSHIWIVPIGSLYGGLFLLIVSSIIIKFCPKKLVT